MKCPKCGFNSFEYYDSCKKCSADLTGYKLTYSIASLILPLEAKEKLIEESRSAQIDDTQLIDSNETHDDIFSFDLPEDSPSASSKPNDDPFNFDEPAHDLNQKDNSTSEDNTFANLLESTSQSEDSPFGMTSAAVTSPTAPAEIKNVSTNAPGEFDLDSFSWDDVPAAPTPVAAPAPAPEDDFDSLFGELKENTNK